MLPPKRDFTLRGNYKFTDLINEALGTGPATNDLNGDGVVNVVDVQIVANAALGMSCTGAF
jgi:hypothetical protein